ncbi:MAG: KpsF/GutQ family sugar-phosphate isomerase [Candidatus Caenarcaniphilales bacterium]|nr:KpsF/GutQ family sugar-phosphate isomerase [Candidatus Caenarcaniphilales bacterium]
MNPAKQKQDQTSPQTKTQIIAEAKKVIKTEADALNKLIENLDENFIQAVERILQIKGRVVVTGMGKSGHIASKIAATLASTGTPAFFVHPAELAHGDFGMLTDDDLVIAISNSGETSEVTNILVPIKRRGIPLVGITSNSNSTLAEYADTVLDLGVNEEACPLNLAPTTSTTATLALGDALAVVLMKERGFSREDFAKFHPGGALGRKLIKVSDVMRKGSEEIPVVALNSSYKELLEEISLKKLGFACVVDEKGKLLGMVTDGDLRRAQLNFSAEAYSKQAKDIMNTSPKVISQDALAYEALRLMEEYRISDLIIVSAEQKPIAVIDLKDLLKVGVY